jgi:PucR family transcriptional regulator, purine catabolism regulatory protein
VIDSIALGDLLTIPPLAHARVVGGHEGLRRPVRGVNVMEVPDILDWVKPDELLLTTAYPLRDDPVALDALIPRLAERGLAGIALKPGRYIKAIPVSMIEAADEHAFALIELPPEASFNEIINSVLTVILDVQAARLQRSAAIHDRFTSIALSGGGLRQIAEALAELVGREVAIVDAQDIVQWRTSDGAPGGESGAPAGSTEGHGVGHAGGAIVQTIQVGAERYGAILVAGDEAALGPDRLEAIEYAATVAALRQVQTRAVAEADRRFQAVCLEELITGHVVDRTVLMERAAAFAWDLTSPRAVLLADVEAIAGRPFSALAGTPEEGALRHQLAESARASLGAGAIIWERSREIGALVSAGPTGLPEIGAALQTEASRHLPGIVVSVGIGRAALDPLDLHRSFAEARRALSIGRWARGPGEVTAFDHLGLDRLLVAIPDADAEAFSTDVLGPLEAYDAGRGTSLVTTLETFLATRNAALAARQLYLHYNTLKNRLAKIEEIIGPYLDDPDRCLSLALALRLRRLPKS